MGTAQSPTCELTDLGQLRAFFELGDGADREYPLSLIEVIRRQWAEKPQLGWLSKGWAGDWEIAQIWGCYVAQI